MAQPDSGEYSVRSLAEILREHGLETELGTRPGRRRRTSDDPQATGRSPRVEPAPRPTGPNGSPVAARSATPVRTPGQVPTPARSPAGASPARVPVTTWPDQSSTGPRPAAGLTGPAAPVREPAPEVRNSPADRVPATGRGAGNADVAPPAVRRGRRKSDAEPTGTGSTARAVTGSTTGSAPGSAAVPAVRRPGPSTSAIPAITGQLSSRRGDAHPVTGPIPVQRAEAQPEAVEDDEPLTGRQTVLAWVRFLGELVVALAVGIGLYFAFTVLWELMPYVALVAAPLSVTALVAGVAAWRQRQGQGALGVRLLAVLLLAGTVLVIAPAAGLLAG